VEALGKGLQLADLMDDIDRQNRKSHPEIGAAQR
jgi:hypothetical protein